MSTWRDNDVPENWWASAADEGSQIFVVAKDPVALEGRAGRIPKVFGPDDGGLDSKEGTLREKDRGGLVAWIPKLDELEIRLRWLGW